MTKGIRGMKRLFRVKRANGKIMDGRIMTKNKMCGFARLCTINGKKQTRRLI